MEIRDTLFDSRPALEILTSKARMIIATDFGPRIAHFGSAAGRNLLFWDETGRHAYGPWKLRGGHRIWATRPLADEAEETYDPDNAPCRVERLEKGVVVTAAENAAARITKSLVVTVLDENTFQVENRIRNTGNMLWSGGIWALTCTVPGPSSVYGVPLGDHSGWDAFALVIPKRWGGTHASRVDDPQIALTEDCLVLTPQGVETKRMIQAPQGIIGMTDAEEGLSFVKRVPFEAGLGYPLSTNIAFYVGKKNFMVEMETMGPEKVVKPGATLVHAETWRLGPPVDWKGLQGPFPA